MLEDLERSWGITLDRPLPGGSASYVSTATTRSGTTLVVKVAVAADRLDDQARTLQRAAGCGYALLKEYDADRHALLLEALGTPLENSGRPPADQLRILADTLRLAWQPVGDIPPAAPGADKASGLHTLVSDLWTQLDRPCPERVVRQALHYAEALRTPEPAELVVVHGDPHPGNALAVERGRPGGETGYCFVDPDGFVADRAYDLGVALRDWGSRLDGPDARRTAEGFADIRADRSGVEATRIWQWGFLERVSTGLYLMSFGATELGRRFLQVAERLVD
ncbi:MAG TPA: aminoglycoside phosphotransferase family protein [Propionibacteriaceae bacterium]|nr:aminoglycoside phosphotransferase family protein [Propionibacteriaceae bacterium]